MEIEAGRQVPCLASRTRASSLNNHTEWRGNAGIGTPLNEGPTNPLVTLGA